MIHQRDPGSTSLRDEDERVGDKEKGSECHCQSFVIHFCCWPRIVAVCAHKWCGVFSERSVYIRSKHLMQTLNQTEQEEGGYLREFVHLLENRTVFLSGDDFGRGNLRKKNNIHEERYAICE